MRTSMRQPASFLLAALLVLPGPIAPATITVDGNDSSITPGDGICALREAINNANSDSDTSGGDCVAGAGPDTVVLTTDVTLDLVDLYSDSEKHGYRGLPLISTDITIEGSGFTIARDGTAPEFGLFAVDPTGVLSLNHTTVSGGYAANNSPPYTFGGGISSYGTLNLNDSTVSGNYARYGGGIVMKGGITTLTNSSVSDNSAGTIRLGGEAGGLLSLTWTPGAIITLIDSTVSGNSAYFGGGIRNGRYSELTLTNSTVSGNAATDIGGIMNNSGTTTLINTTVSGNSADDSCGGVRTDGGSTTLVNSTVSDNSASRVRGGGICSIQFGTTTLINSTVSGNSAAYGGGIFTKYEGNTTLINSTVSGNSAEEEGGGIFTANEGTTTLTNSTVSGNSAGTVGGGIYTNSLGTTTLTATIVADSVGDDCAGSGVVNDGGANFREDRRTCPGSPITPGVDFDTTVADNGGPTLTHALLPGSVAIDAAGDCGLETDQRGVPRDDGACDSGSYEFISADEIPCEDIVMFRSRCRARDRGNRLEGRILMTDASHDGERVWVAVDGSPMAVVISGDKAQLRVRSASSGRHRVALMVPTGCFPERRVHCP